MRSSIMLAAAALAIPAMTSPLVAPRAEISELQMQINNLFRMYSTGFRQDTARQRQSTGGLATCISGIINVTASATNHDLNLTSPADQTAVTGFFLNQVQAGSTLLQQVTGPPRVVNGTWGIAAQLCFPGSPAAMAKNHSSTVQLLVHGAGCDGQYWDAAAGGYSYVDAAAEAGYATLSFDRLGSGQSDHPDPIQTVQLGVHAAVAHELAQKLRTGALANRTFSNVVGVGHSLGSATVTLVTAQHPKDFDAVVITGFAAPDPTSSGGPGQAISIAGINLHIAAEVDPLRFYDLPAGYLTSPNMAASEFFFFKPPGFDPALLRVAEAGKGIFTLGELITFGDILPATNFTGPVDVVTGEADLPFCQGDCLHPSNKLAGTRGALFPNAKPNGNGSDYFVPKGAGHAINYHYSAVDAYAHIQQFVQKNGF